MESFQDQSYMSQIQFPIARLFKIGKKVIKVVNFWYGMRKMEFMCKFNYLVQIHMALKIQSLS